MAQADSLNTTSPSRRTLLAGISIAAAPAVLAGSLSASEALGAHLSCTDATLLALGVRFEALLPEVRAKQAAAAESADAADEEVERRLGFNVYTSGRAQQQFDEAWEMLKVIRGEMGTETRIHECNEAFGRANRIHAEVIAARAYTMSGFAVKARVAAALSLPHLWDEPVRDLDFDKSTTRLLIEDICAAAGVSLTDLGDCA